MRKHAKNLFILTLAVLYIGTLQPLKASPDKYTSEIANEYVQAGDWQSAVKAYKYLTQQEADNGSYWFFLGYSHHNLGDYPKAVKAYSKANESGFYAPIVRYNMACAHARMGNIDKAHAWLDKSLQAGFGKPELLKSDDDLESIRSDAQFAGYVKQAKMNSAPCEYNDNCRQLDFWLGEWQVYNAQGTMVGTNRIEKALNGCAIMENWEGTSGIKGKSVNYYNPHENKWYQNWVSANGTIINYEGYYKDGVMHLAGTSINKEGETEMSKMNLTPNDDGTVTQLIKHSKDGGENWYVWFKGLYKPANEMSVSDEY